MKILGYDIDETGCESHSCVIAKDKSGPRLNGPCTCLPRVDVATRKKLITRINCYVRPEDVGDFLKRNDPGTAWCSECPVCGNSTFNVIGAGVVCDTPGCSHTHVGN